MEETGDEVELSGVTFHCAKIPMLRRIKHPRMLGHYILGKDNSKVRAPAMAGIDAQGTERCCVEVAVSMVLNEPGDYTKVMEKGSGGNPLTIVPGT